MRSPLPRQLLVAAVLLAWISPAHAADEPPQAVYPVAILPFSERGRDAAEMAAKTTDLLFANLVANPELYLVDRQDLDKLLEEQNNDAPGAA